MSKFSTPQSVKSNARRAAKKLGVDASKVVPAPGGGFYFPLPDPSAGAGVPATAPVKAPRKASAKKKAKVRKAKAAKPAKAKKAAKPAKAKASAGRRANGAGAELVAKIAKLMRRKAGASISEVVALTSWQKHTARARISVQVSELLAKGEVINRRRMETATGVKESVYFIEPSRQLELKGL